VGRVRYRLSGLWAGVRLPFKWAVANGGRLKFRVWVILPWFGFWPFYATMKCLFNSLYIICSTFNSCSTFKRFFSFSGIRTNVAFYSSESSSEILNTKKE
jgi:hypothetical protein